MARTTEQFGKRHNRTSEFRLTHVKTKEKLVLYPGQFSAFGRVFNLNTASAAAYRQAYPWKDIPVYENGSKGDANREPVWILSAAFLSQIRCEW